MQGTVTVLKVRDVSGRFNFRTPVSIHRAPNYESEEISCRRGLTLCKVHTKPDYGAYGLQRHYLLFTDTTCLNLCSIPESPPGPARGQERKTSYSNNIRASSTPLIANQPTLDRLSGSLSALLPHSIHDTSYHNCYFLAPTHFVLC